MTRTSAEPSEAPDTSPSADAPANKPVDKFREGSVHVSIWENTGAKGLFRTASFQLRYKDGEEWRTSQSYGLLDLEHMEKAAAEARARIERWQQAATGKPAQRPG